MEITTISNAKNGVVSSRVTTRNPTYRNFVNENCKTLNTKVAESVRMLDEVVNQYVLPLVNNIGHIEEEEAKVKLKNVKNVLRITDLVIMQYQTLGRLNSDIAIAESNTINNYANKIANAELAESVEPEYREAINQEEKNFKDISVNVIDQEMDENIEDDIL